MITTRKLSLLLYFSEINWESLLAGAVHNTAGADVWFPRVVRMSGAVHSTADWFSQVVRMSGGVHSTADWFSQVVRMSGAVHSTADWFSQVVRMSGGVHSTADWFSQVVRMLPGASEKIRSYFKIKKNIKWILSH